MIYPDADFSLRRGSMAGYVTEEEGDAPKKHKRLHNTCKKDGYR